MAHPGAQISTVHGEDVHINDWELFGQRAIRERKWKAVWINSAKEEWELYDFGVDPGELDDIAEREPGVLERLVEPGGFVRPS